MRRLYRVVAAEPSLAPSGYFPLATAGHLDNSRILSSPISEECSSSALEGRAIDDILGDDGRAAVAGSLAGKDRHPGSRG